MDRRRSSIRSIKGDFGRGNWANKTEFFLSCLGYAIGIGNVWRFPYLCYRNGGGAFLVPYLLMLVLCGIPLFFMETTLGQFSGNGCITMFRIAPLFKGAGYAIIVVNILCTVYYNVIIAYPILFIINCLRSRLPWADCNNPWNSKNCLSLNNADDIYSNHTQYSPQIKTFTPAEEFFSNQILDISEGIESVGSIVWPLFGCLLFTWVVVYLCIMKGVKSIGKVVYFTATFPFLILFVLLLRGVTLPGAWDGIEFYIYPQWNHLANLKVWTDAAVQIFFSLGPGWGGIVNMASYNEFRNNNKRDAILVPILNCGTSIFAGFVVFSILGFMSYKTGLPVSKVATGGPGLAFVTYPEAITLLPWPHLWAILFFFMLFLLGLDSCFVQIEAITASIIDEYPRLTKHKQLVCFMYCFVMFLGSMPFVTNGGMYWLQLFDWYAASISIISVCLVEVIIVGWTYGCKNFVRDLEYMTQIKVSWWWTFCWKFVTPVILVFIFITSILFNTNITYQGREYPEWSIHFGWSLCAASIVCIPTYAIYKVACLEQGGLLERIRSALQPDKKWGPAIEPYRKEWLNVLHNSSNEEIHKMGNNCKFPKDEVAGSVRPINIVNIERKESY